MKPHVPFAAFSTFFNSLLKPRAKWIQYRKTESVCSAWVFPVGDCRPNLIAGTTQPQKSKMLMSMFFDSWEKMGIASANACNPTHLPLWSPPRHGLREESALWTKFERIPSFHLCFIHNWKSFMISFNFWMRVRFHMMSQEWLSMPSVQKIPVFENFEFLQTYHASPLSYQLPRHLLWSCHSYLLIQRCVFIPCSGGETVLLSSKLFSYSEISEIEFLFRSNFWRVTNVTKDTNVQTL